MVMPRLKLKLKPDALTQNLFFESRFDACHSFLSEALFLTNQYSIRGISALAKICGHFPLSHLINPLARASSELVVFFDRG